jgi:hypothetical protein
LWPLTPLTAVQHAVLWRNNQTSGRRRSPAARPYRSFAHRHIDLQAYLTDLLTKLVNLWPASNLDELMPRTGAAEPSFPSQSSSSSQIHPPHLPQQWSTAAFWLPANVEDEICHRRSEPTASQSVISQSTTCGGRTPATGIPALRAL